MCKYLEFVIYLCFLFASSKPTECRKYDVEADAMKLYGEDLHTVLARFKRTPDYLKILKARVAIQDNIYGDIVAHVQTHFIQKLSDEVAAMMTNKEESEQSVQPSYMRNRRLFPGIRRQADKNVTRTDRLDKYYKLTSNLTLQQKNALKDLGFVYAGHVIHTLIKSLIRSADSDDHQPPRSTMLPDGGEQKKIHEVTTTEHVAVHEVTTTEGSTLADPPSHTKLEEGHGVHGRRGGHDVTAPPSY